MKIAEITTYKEGGAYTHVVELIKGINAETLIITGNTKKSGFQKENGNTFFHVPAMKRMWEVFFINHIGAYRTLEDLCKKEKVDLVHFHSPLFTFLHGFLNKNKFPAIMTTHYLLEVKTGNQSNVLYNRFIRGMTRYIGKRVDRIICVNKDYIPVFTKWGVNPEKLLYIPNGVDTRKFSPGKSKIRGKYKDSKLIVYFGRLHYQKNVHLLIKGFKQVKEKIKNAKLILIGTGNQYEKLKRMSADDNDIIMTGFVPDNKLVDYIRAADAVVFPSRGENASFTIMEAMACELPVISSDVGNARQILDDGRGVVFDSYSKEVIAKECIKILGNEKLAKNIGKKAREYVVENHSWDKISKKTEELYHVVIDEWKNKNK